MYRPEKYIKDDPEHILQFILKNPFATIISTGSELTATHIPVIVEDEGNLLLSAHIANHNTQIRQLRDGAKVLLVFQGAHAYISSSWYAEKDISTWDYSAVHVHAEIKLQNMAELQASLRKLVNRFEKDQQDPLNFEELPEPMIQDHIGLITGFWLKPYKVQGIAKLHQNYTKGDLQNVTAKLKSKDDPLAKQLSQDIQDENKL